MRTVGTVSRGVRCPVVKQGDDIGTTVSSTIVEVRIGDVAVEPLSVLRGECGALQVG